MTDEPVRKPFSEALYNTDDSAKDQLVAYLIKRGYEAWVNPNDYGIDVCAIKDGEKYYFEVEVKHNWKGKDFPFDTLHYADRKLKFLKSAAQRKNTWFVTLNHQRKYAVTVNGEILINCQVVKKDTIYTKGEGFIQVPVEATYLIKV